MNAIYEAVSTTYGPRGKNVLIEKNFGRPVLTRDGVTVARDTFFKDRAKNMGSQLLLEASETSNRQAGDGTSATVVMGYHLYKNGLQAIAAGKHPMEIKDQIIEDSRVVLDKLETLAIKVKDEQLKDVATVSSGDPLVGELIAESILKVGLEGGIITEKAPIANVQRDYVDGYFLQSGFTAMQLGKKEIADPSVIVSAKRITSGAEIVDILNRVMQINKIPQGQILRVVFIGNFEDAAYQTIIENLAQARIDAIVIKTPPQFGAMSNELLEDIALYAGCQAITSSVPTSDIDETYIGKLDKIVANKSEATLFADPETQLIQERIKQIKDQLDTEVADHVAEKYRDRIAKLEGKIAIFKIGGATDTEREELEFRIEDAINATRAAYAEGIVAGGGVTLLELSKCDVSKITSEALQTAFQKLLTNANLPAELKLDEALKAKSGMGYNLRKGGELVDVVKDGVIDPLVVVREVITNASSAAANAITIEAALIFTDEEK